jgi:hypothetical protein
LKNGRHRALHERRETGLDERESAQQLEREGFGHTYVWQDGANAFYP